MTRSRRGRAPRGRSVRAFYALPLPEDVAEALAAWGARCAAGDRELRATPIERLHVTVAFLGARPAGQVQALAEALEHAPGPWVPLAVRAAGRLAEGRVLAAVLDDPEGAFGRLAHRVGVAAGLPAPRRPLPHVSVARGRGPAPTGAPGARPWTGPPPPPAEGWIADRLVLCSSELRPEGPRYVELAGTAA